MSDNFQEVALKIKKEYMDMTQVELAESIVYAACAMAIKMDTTPHDILRTSIATGPPEEHWEELENLIRLEWDFDS